MQVNVEVALTARYWTRIFVVCTILSYVLGYAFMLVFMWVETSFDMYDPEQYGVIYQICTTPSFWFLQVRWQGGAAGRVAELKPTALDILISAFSESC